MYVGADSFNWYLCDPCAIHRCLLKNESTVLFGGVFTAHPVKCSFSASDGTVGANFRAVVCSPAFLYYSWNPSIVVFFSEWSFGARTIAYDRARGLGNISQLDGIRRLINRGIYCTFGLSACTYLSNSIVISKRSRFVPGPVYDKPTFSVK